MVVYRWKAMDIMLLLKLLILVLSVNPSVHNSHGKRIDRKAAAKVGVITGFNKVSYTCLVPFSRISKRLSQK